MISLIICQMFVENPFQLLSTLQGVSLHIYLKCDIVADGKIDATQKSDVIYVASSNKVSSTK